ncbi:hypothetical protein HYV91_01595 [Candidatus Wolfebacteria bacterium]|nr:hypothetical protein [Candidatus Wolfebacteria bacterium]
MAVVVAIRHAHSIREEDEAMEIEIESVAVNSVTIRVFGTFFCFSLIDGVPRMVAKYRHSRIHDPVSSRVPMHLFLAARRQAAAILRDQKRQKIQKQADEQTGPKLSPQLVLF